MNDRQEIENLEAQSRWSGKRFVLLYWMALMFLGTGFAVGLGTGVLNPKYTVSADHAGKTFTEPWHPDECSGTYCHSDELTAWGKTMHNATYFNGTHVLVGGSRPYNISDPIELADFLYCAHCMTTRFNASDNTYWDYGITCAACHEPGEINRSTAICGQCHDEYQVGGQDVSAHNESLWDILKSSREDISSCLHCLSGQGLLMDYPNPDLTRANNESLTGIVCSTCHNPHDGTYEYQLRVNGTTELCGQCHGTIRKQADGTTPLTTHHLTWDVFTGSEHAHSEMDCADCHGYTIEWGSRGPSRVWNHSWTIDPYYSCNGTRTLEDGTEMGCHANTTIQLSRVHEIIDHFNESIIEVEEYYETVLDLVDDANGTANVNQHMVDLAYAMVDEAYELFHTIEYGSAMGFHNVPLTASKLFAAEELLNQAKALAQTAIDTAEAPPEPVVSWTTFVTTITETPGFGLVSVLFAVSLLGVAVLLFRKRR